MENDEALRAWAANVALECSVHDESVEGPFECAIGGAILNLHDLNRILRKAVEAVDERALIVAWFRHAAHCVRLDADAGLWDGIEDEIQASIDTFNGYADAIERGDHMPKD